MTERGADRLLPNKGMSTVEIIVVFRSLQKKITEQCIELTIYSLRLCMKIKSASTNKRGDRNIVHIGDGIAAFL